MFEKENPKDTKEEYESWINKFTKQVNTISSILNKDILYYEDLYYGKVDLKDITFYFHSQITFCLSLSH